MNNDFRQYSNAILDSIEQVLIGKREQLQLALCCLFARGHLLIEDLPGMGKTTLAHALATVLGLDYKRVQFTSDLLPADILGVSVFDRNRAEFVFHPGPVFSQLVLADEINRATPKTQSALLEAMAESRVSIEGQTYDLPQPFFVIATQNPASQSGTFPLPESQLDRFAMRLRLGYPDPKSERELLAGRDPAARLRSAGAALELGQLQSMQAAIAEVKTSDSLVAYLQRLLQFTRNTPEIEYGISPRGGLAVLRCARAWALMEGRDYVIPEDVQAVFVPVCAHRLPALGGAHAADNVAQLALNAVDII